MKNPSWKASVSWWISVLVRSPVFGNINIFFKNLRPSALVAGQDTDFSQFIFCLRDVARVQGPSHSAQLEGFDDSISYYKVLSWFPGFESSSSFVDVVLLGPFLFRVCQLRNRLLWLLLRADFFYIVEDVHSTEPEHNIENAPLRYLSLCLPISIS